MAFQSLEDYVLRSAYKFLFYGKPGVGKTLLASTSRYFRTAHFDIDVGMLSLQSDWRPNVANGMKVARIDSINDFDRDLDWFCKNADQFGLVVVDTASELQRYMIAGQLQVAKRVLPQQADWNIALMRMETLARVFRSLPCHVIWLCHEMHAIDADSGRNVFRPAFQGQFGTLMYHKHFDVIGRVFLHEQQATDPQTNLVQTQIQRYLSCAPSPYWETKDRSGALPEFLMIPTEEQVFAGEMSGIDYLISTMQQRMAEIVKQRTVDANQSGIVQGVV